MIFRTIHDKSNPYFQLNRTAVNDERLSYKAIGIHTYLMSKPDGWEANISDLVNRHPDGLAAVRSGVNELVSLGYIKRIRQTDDKGRVTGWTMDVYETPHNDASPECENQIVASPECDYPQVENPQVENHTLVINKERETDKKRLVVADATPHAPLKIEEKKTRKPRASQVEANLPSESVVVKPPTEHQMMFEKICQIVGWDYKTLDEKAKGQVAQTLGILKAAGYTLDELKRFGREVWSKDWRWTKKKEYPTLTDLRQEIGKVKRHNTPHDINGYENGTSWKQAFASQKTPDYIKEMIVA